MKIEQAAVFLNLSSTPGQRLCFDEKRQELAPVIKFLEKRRESSTTAFFWQLACTFSQVPAALSFRSTLALCLCNQPTAAAPETSPSTGIITSLLIQLDRNPFDQLKSGPGPLFSWNHLNYSKQTHPITIIEMQNSLYFSQNITSRSCFTLNTGA